jgi:hypothetical protein
MPAKPLRAVPKKAALIDVPLVGWICGYDQEQGLVLVDFPQNQLAGAIAARSTVELDQALIAMAVAEKQRAVLVFEEGDPLQPIVVGLIKAPMTATAGVQVQLPTLPTGLRADGKDKRVVLEAADEIVLQCGTASITLRRNGRVVIRGAYVETRSQGVNRIKGGSVQIN